MKKPEFEEIVSFLEGAFRTELSPKERDAYWLLWATEEGPAFMQAAIGYAKSERARYGFPKPGDLLRQTNHDLLALLACETAIRCSDAWNSVHFEDETIHHVIEALGGWLKWCEMVRWMPERDFRFVRADFERLYMALRSAPPSRKAPALIGEFELHNAKREEWRTQSQETHRITCDYLALERRELEVKAGEARRLLENPMLDGETIG